MSSEGARTVESLTLEEFERLPEEDARRLELVRGRLVREPPPGARHGDIAARLCLLLGSYAAETGRGRVAIEAGFLLAEDPPTVREPDVAFVSRESLPQAGPPQGFWRLVPALAVEVVSPSNTVAGMQEKVLDYLDAGVRLVWVVDPSNEIVTVHRSRGHVCAVGTEGCLEGEDVLPGLKIGVAELFAP